jgi:hypothetical protein
LSLADVFRGVVEWGLGRGERMDGAGQAGKNDPDLASCIGAGGFASSVSLSLSPPSSPFKGAPIFGGLTQYDMKKGTGTPLFWK